MAARQHRSHTSAPGARAPPPPLLPMAGIPVRAPTSKHPTRQTAVVPHPRLGTVRTPGDRLWGQDASARSSQHQHFLGGNPAPPSAHTQVCWQPGVTNDLSKGPGGFSKILHTVWGNRILWAPAPRKCCLTYERLLMRCPLNICYYAGDSQVSAAP